MDPSAGFRGPFPTSRAAAWILYDLANTVYAATVTFLFAPHAAAALAGKTGLGVVQTVSMILAGLLVPFCGVWIDRTRKAHVGLLVATMGCIACMACWAAPGTSWLLPCFFVANLSYNLALLFYNSLLPSVAPQERAGLVSGIGTGLGYFGTILVLVMLLDLDGTQTQFALAALAFLLLALPCFVLVRDARRPTAATGGPVARETVQQTLRLLRNLPHNRPMALFLAANFCLVDVLNTAVLFFADFTIDLFGAPIRNGAIELLGLSFQGKDGVRGFVQLCGLLLNGLALVFGVMLGLVADRRPLETMKASAWMLLLALVGGTICAGASPLGYVLTLVVGGAFGLSGIWTAGRKVVLILAPPEQIGGYFGLYGITTKLSVLGSTIYAVVADAFGARPAMASQAIQLLIGMGLLFMVRLPKPAAAAAR